MWCCYFVQIMLLLEYCYKAHQLCCYFVRYIELLFLQIMLSICESKMLKFMNYHLLKYCKNEILIFFYFFIYKLELSKFVLICKYVFICSNIIYEIAYIYSYTWNIIKTCLTWNIIETCLIWNRIETLIYETAYIVSTNAHNNVIIVTCIFTCTSTVINSHLTTTLYMHAI